MKLLSVFGSGCLILMGAHTLSAAQTTRKSETTSIHIADYLVRSKFSGVQLDGPAVDRKYIHEHDYSRLKTTGKSISITFEKASHLPRKRGTYRMSLGLDRYAGEWNISGTTVHLWIDTINGKPRKAGQEPMEVYFQAPRAVDEPFVMYDIYSDATAPRLMKGLFLLKVDDPRYRDLNAKGTFRSGAGIVFD